MYTRHQRPLDGVKLCGLNVDYINSSNECFAYIISLEVKSCLIKKKWIDFTFDNRLQKPVAEMKSASCLHGSKVWSNVVL
jgi:hypothetical protein